MKNNGFTIVELIVVIVVIGILAAVALPRFLGLSDRAHDAVVEGTQSALASGVVMAKSVWLAEGRESPLDNIISKVVDTCVAATTASPACAGGGTTSRGLEANGSGYPTGHTQDDDKIPTAVAKPNAISSNADCVEVFEFLLSESSVRAADKAKLTGTDADEAFEFAASNSTTTCLYEYLPDIADRFSTTTYRTIRYDSLTGRVTVTNLSSTGETST